MTKFVYFLCKSLKQRQISQTDYYISIILIVSLFFYIAKSGKPYK